MVSNGGKGKLVLIRKIPPFSLGSFGGMNTQFYTTQSRLPSISPFEEELCLAVCVF